MPGIVCNSAERVAESGCCLLKRTECFARLPSEDPTQSSVPSTIVPTFYLGGNSRPCWYVETRSAILLLAYFTYRTALRMYGTFYFLRRPRSSLFTLASPPRP